MAAEQFARAYSSGLMDRIAKLGQTVGDWMPDTTAGIERLMAFFGEGEAQERLEAGIGGLRAESRATPEQLAQFQAGVAERQAAREQKNIDFAAAPTLGGKLDVSMRPDEHPQGAWSAVEGVAGFFYDGRARRGRTRRSSTGAADIERARPGASR